jgi:hypothetical protein
MNNFFKRILESPWTYKQPLTILPKDRLTSISDLFFWVRNDEFEVFFELLNLDYLTGSIGQSQVEIVFFNKTGYIFFKEQLDLSCGYRQHLNITKILEQNSLSSISGDYGTFAIFHLNTPKIVTDMNSFVAERGYVSYRYKKSPIASYVHGNYDAIGKSGSEYIPLGGESFIKRRYDLQYLFLPEKKYRLVLVNPCKKSKKISINLISIANQKIKKISLKINPKASVIHDLENFSEPSRISIHSKIVMARPIIFCVSADNIDVFHG